MSIQQYEIHGQMKQKKRDKIYDEFRTSKSGVLISTDVCARGVDFYDVHDIIQADPP